MQTCHGKTFSHVRERDLQVHLTSSLQVKLVLYDFTLEETEYFFKFLKRELLPPFLIGNRSIQKV